MLIKETTVYMVDGKPCETLQEAKEELAEVVANHLHEKFGAYEEYLTDSEILELIDFIVENAEAIKTHV